MYFGVKLEELKTVMRLHPKKGCARTNQATLTSHCTKTLSTLGMQEVLHPSDASKVIKVPSKIMSNSKEEFTTLPYFSTNYFDQSMPLPGWVSQMPPATEYATTKTSAAKEFSEGFYDTSRREILGKTMKEGADPERKEVDSGIKLLAEKLVERIPPRPCLVKAVVRLVFRYKNGTHIPR